jgi:uncharacterized protein (TIGR02996 family)
MSEEAALLGAIRDNPDEDTPRLVYADWLQENDQVERAEFIRLQCEAVRMPRDSQERGLMLGRATVLKEKHNSAWFGSLEKQFRSCIIERGFVSRLCDDAEKFQKHSPMVEKYAPVLESAAVWFVKDTASDLLALPFARFVRRLSMGEVMPPSLAALAQAKLPANIDDLTLYTETLREADVALAFLEAPFVRTPQRLSLVLDFMAADSDDVELAEPHSLRVLERLDLPNLRGFGTWGINDAVAEAIAAWPGLARLDELLFGLTWIVDSALSRILASPLFPDIRQAFLDENFLKDGSCIAVAQCAKFASAKYLDLGENTISDEGAIALADSPYMANLEYLSLWNNHLTRKGDMRLRQRFGNAYESQF